MIEKIKTIFSKKKRLAALGMAIILGIGTIVYATTPHLSDANWNDPTVWPGWTKEATDKATAMGYIPTGLAVNSTWLNVPQTGGAQYPLGAVRFLTTRPGATVPEDFKEFDGKYIYCVANHVPNYVLNNGMQAFYMKKWDPATPFKYCAGTDEIKEFNFIMLAIACNYGTENSDYHPEELSNAYYGIVSQAIAWICTASTPEQRDYKYFKGESFKDDLEVLRGYPIYDAIMNRSFPQNINPSIYNYLHAPSPNDWHSQEGCQNMFEAIFADIWHSASLTKNLDIKIDVEKSTLTGQSELGDDGYYHMYINVFQSEAMKIYLNGISFAPGAGSDWEQMETSADGLMHFRSVSGDIPEDGSIGKLYWPNTQIGSLMPKDLSSAKLYTFTFFTPENLSTAGDPKSFTFGKTQTHFGSVIDKDLEIYITEGDDHEQEPEADVNVQRYEHEEGFQTNYNVNLHKFDSETGKPIEGAHFDILESFDDSQLDETALDMLKVEGYVSHLGSLNQTDAYVDDIPSNYNGDLGVSVSDANLYNWANGNGTQFEHWTDPHNDPCDRDDNVTDENGVLCEIYSNGESSGIEAHTDTKNYTYHKGYCGGHPAPEIEYIECDHEEDEDCDCEEENQKIHDDAWDAWYKEVVKCENLASKGGFFHAINIGEAQKAMETDRDQFYKDFISLKYEYSAKEIKAAEGYIRHGIHTDDIPIETRTVTSSEYKDTDEATNLQHKGGSSDNDEETFIISTNTDKEIKVVAEEVSRTIATPSEAEEFLFEDEEVATPSEATLMKTGYAQILSDDDSENAPKVSFKESIANRIQEPEHFIIDWTFIVYNHRTEGEIHFNKRDLDLQNDESGEYNSYADANGDGDLEGAVYGLFTANNIEHPDGHTGIVYEQGDLIAITTTDRNGDGSFMAITEAPGYTYDYKTGSIIKTDSGWADKAPKNLHINEGESADKEEDIESFIGHNPDNTEITAGNGNDLIDTSAGDTDEWFKKYSSNQGYEDTTTSTTTGYYPISNNEDNNGNCWIGRPLFVEAKGTQYYIKELSRSEGYELSVYGKDDSLVTNKDANEAGGDEFNSGTVSAGDIQLDTESVGNTFTLKSAGTTDGYDVTITNIGEGAEFFITSKEYVWDDSVSHKEQVQKQVPVYGTPGELVMADGYTWKANLGDTVTLNNGTSYTVNNVHIIDNSKLQVKPSNSEKIENRNLVITNPGTANFLTEVKQAFRNSNFKVPYNTSPWVFVPFDDLTSESIAKAVNEKIFTNPYYDVFNAMTIVGTTAKNNQMYAIITYDYIEGNNINSLYNESNDSVYVKKPVVFKSEINEYNGYVWKAYNNYEDAERNDSNFIINVNVPNERITNNFVKWHSDDLNLINYEKVQNESFWAYAENEQLIDVNGNPATKIIIEEIDVTPTLVPIVTDIPIENVLYENGIYKFKVSQELAEENPEMTIRIKCSKEISDNNGDFAFYLQVYNDGIVSTSIPMKNAGSYIETIFLTYPDDETVKQDANTIATPISIYERPIRQKVKVVKDIQTTPDSEEYIHDTYSEVHKENLSENSYGWYEKTKDWLSSLLGKEVPDESASKIPEFRFKTYLKSNLERLYRNENGQIIWLDRNGNPLVPEYKDTNNDGNYDTFTWVTGNNTIDFPEKDKTNDTSLTSANVQKIYTQVEHNINSTTTGDISNNTWAEYGDPQTGNTTNVGELRPDNTSQDGENGEAVRTNGALYSYDDKNTNVKETDKINEAPNTGYTRLLETEVRLVEDGNSTREVEEYNYEKFFDAIRAANNDKWDNDMYASKKNYPGQHWFETFEERYQKDDADPDRTLANVDGTDLDGTAGGDRDTSFKPFQWIRENLFGTTQDAKDDYPVTHDNDNLENNINTSQTARENAEASDEVRQFAIKWYLDDEVAKLVTNNGYDEDVAKEGYESYQEEVYDVALSHALAKAYNYLKPFYEYDLDTIYSVEWDSAENGGSDNDYTTLSADTLYNITGSDESESKNGYYYGVSAYLPYGTYVLVEQQPFREDLGDFDNKHYKTDLPKELILPAVYEEDGHTGSPEEFNDFYTYNSADTPEELTKKYMIRFNEEWADNHTDDLRKYVIRAHNYDGDYEIYKYGLDVDKLTDKITYSGGEYDYAGFSITQEVNDPLKDYYNTMIDSKEEGGNDNSHYYGDDKNKGVATANGSTYATDAIEKRYHYGSISENAGMASDVLHMIGQDKNDNNPSGQYYKDDVKTMTGNQTAYHDKYASMLVPWSVVEPVESDVYDITNFTGYADKKFRNTFYGTKLRIEKLDSETGEQLLHDNAIFSIYAASRYTSREEVEEAIAKGAPATTEIGDVKFYLEDTQITGSKEFLESMKATNIQPVSRGKLDQYTGIVPKGTPVCLEEEQIIMEDMLGAKVGQFKVYTTLNDVKVLNEEDDNKSFQDQNTGYLTLPQPLGAGVYVLVETAPPAGYARTNPIAIEIYSDKVEYYLNGSMENKVEATIYEGNLITD